MMKKLFDKINSYIKNIGIFNRIHKERFMVNFSEEMIKYLKDICKIPKEENIIMALDDSHFKNLDQILVFTNEKIYWTIKNVSVKTKVKNTEINIKGKGVIDNKLLNSCSVFSRTEKNVKMIYIISESVQFVISFVNFEIEDSLKLAFYDHISNYCGGYKPNNEKNETLFKKILKDRNVLEVNIFTKIFNIISYIFTLGLIVNVILKYYNYNFIKNEKIICIIILIKLLAMFFGSKKSMYSFFLLFILTYIILKIPEYYFYAHYNIVYLIYAGLILLLNAFDFDKIFRYLSLILALISLVFMIIKYFNLQEIILLLF